MSLTMLHEIDGVHLELKPNNHGKNPWLTINITNSSGHKYEVDCFSADKPLSITFGDDKLVSE